MHKYYKQYQWSNVFAMLRNQKLDPKKCSKDFKNRLVVITGATSGIGYEVARKYAAQGANILSINRNEKKSKKLCEKLKRDYDAKCSYFIADFSKLSDVHEVGKKLRDLDQDIDVLIHNAGVYLTEKAITDDGLEQVFQTNYLSTFIINHYLKDRFIHQNFGRIIYVSSEAYRFAVWGLKYEDLNWDKRRYSGIKSYGSAKLAQLLSIIKFNDIFADSKVTINAMHPGNVKTNSGNTNGKLYKLFKKLVIDRNAIAIENASEAIYFLGVSEEVEDISGAFFNLTTKEELAPPALDEEAADLLWQISLKLGRIQ